MKPCNIPKIAPQLSDLDHAKLDPCHCLTDGLFRPLQRNKAALQALAIQADYKTHYIIHWSAPEQLGITDQSVFIALHRLASDPQEPKSVWPDEQDAHWLSARNGLQLSENAAKDPAYGLDTTYYELARVMGLAKSGTNAQTIERSLSKLANVRISIYKKTKPEEASWASNLIAYRHQNDRLAIVLNPLLSQAVRTGPFSFINLAEQRQLKSEVSKRLHVWLTAWLPEGKQGKISIDKLIPHIWGDTIESAQRTRKNRLRSALEELSKLNGWVCAECETTLNVVVIRPRLKSVKQRAKTAR